MIKMNLFDSKEWIELKPYGISVGPLQTRPVLLLKNEEKEVTLPVWMMPHQVVESVAGADGVNLPSGPHSITAEIFKSMDLKLDRCVFKELKGQHQYVDLYFQGHPTQKKMRFRAAEAMPLCLQLKTPFFAQREFVESCRQLDAEIFDGEDKNPLESLLKRRQGEHLM